MVRIVMMVALEGLTMSVESLTLDEYRPCLSVSRIIGTRILPGQAKNLQTGSLMLFAKFRSVAGAYGALRLPCFRIFKIKAIVLA